VFAFFIFANLTIAPLLYIDLGRAYTGWMVVPTVLFFFSPMLNDFIMWAFRLNPLRTLVYTVSVILLYGSMLTTSLVSAVKGIFGKKARFIVTPKSSRRISFIFALRFQWREIVLSTVLLVISILFHGAVWPVLLIIATGYGSLILLFFSNKRYTEAETARIDNRTSSISFALNPLYRQGKKGEKV
jgi:hypothetical protein